MQLYPNLMAKILTYSLSLSRSLQTWIYSGVFLSSQHAARQMVDQKTGGSIITMSSVNANHTIAAITPYVASKGGISALTKAMALSLADHSIR